MIIWWLHLDPTLAFKSLKVKLLMAIYLIEDMILMASLDDIIS